VKDAVNLGWKLASVIQARAPEGLLGSCETQRQHMAERNTHCAQHFADSVGLCSRPSPNLTKTAPKARPQACS
jgi:2-polyprenyl-6-methoxyphenol hydroxylase-like FAD-dependent oxidoreductase